MAKATMGPVSGADLRTYRGQGGALTRGTAIMAGTADDQVKAPTGAGVRCEGIVEETTLAAGDPVRVVRTGECIAIAGGVVARGDFVKIGGTNGRQVTTTTANDELVGRAVSSAAADGDEFVLEVFQGKL
jgi:hypothetical protein